MCALSLPNTSVTERSLHSARGVQQGSTLCPAAPPPAGVPAAPEELPSAAAPPAYTPLPSGGVLPRSQPTPPAACCGGDSPGGAACACPAAKSCLLEFTFGHRWVDTNRACPLIPIQAWSEGYCLVLNCPPDTTTGSQVHLHHTFCSAPCGAWGTQTFGRLTGIHVATALQAKDREGGRPHRARERCCAAAKRGRSARRRPHRAGCEAPHVPAAPGRRLSALATAQCSTGAQLRIYA